MFTFLKEFFEIQYLILKKSIDNKKSCKNNQHCTALLRPEFFLVELREKNVRFRVEGTKKERKKALKMTS